MNFYNGITEFIFLEDKPAKADVIFIPGGRYGEIAVYGAWLYEQGFAPLILPSGKYGISTGGFEGAISPLEYIEMDFKDECDFLSKILIDNGVPATVILREGQATYTYENAIYSEKLLRKQHVLVRRAILCCQAYHARRCLTYYQLMFPEVEFLVCPVVTRGISRENWFLTEEGIALVLGEVERCGSQFHDIMKDLLKNS